jgi:hypothetical protein
VNSSSVAREGLLGAAFLEACSLKIEFSFLNGNLMVITNYMPKFPL